MEREIERFEAVSEDGETFTVIVFQRFVETTYKSGETRIIPKSLKRYALLDGRHVNYRDADTFQILKTDQIIRKV